MHVGFEEVENREELDGASRPAFVPQELIQRQLVVLGDDVVPGPRPLAGDEYAQVADRLLPHRIGGAALLVLGQQERQPGGMAVGIGSRHSQAAQVDQASRIAHHEWAHRQPEQLAVAEG